MPPVFGGWELPHGMDGLKTTKLLVAATDVVKAEAEIESSPTSIEVEDTESIDTPDLTDGSSALSTEIEAEAEAELPETPTKVDDSHIKIVKPHDYTKEYFPNHPGPNEKITHTVWERLSGFHGAPDPQPAVLPPASDKIAGCGNVPDVQEAVQRTSISGNVTMPRANGMLQALVKEFPAPKGSIWAVDWDYIRRNVNEVQLKEALMTGRGGMQEVKARLITRALKTIYEGNIQRADALEKEITTHVTTPISTDFRENIPGFPALSKLSNNSKGLIIEKIKEDPLSLNWLHDLENDQDILNVLITINGVQIKTASCVLLFSLQRPSFAVDTHVHRFCNWLGWVPPGTNPEKTFYHCDPKIPNHLKHDLHQLFIRHGQTCFRCSGKSKPGSPQWDNTECVLEDLLDRSVAHKKSPKNGPKIRKLQDTVAEAKEGGEEGIDDEVEEETLPTKRAKVGRRKTTITQRVAKDEEGIDDEMEESPVQRAGAGVKAGKRHREDDDEDYKEKPAKKQRVTRAKKVGVPKQVAISKNTKEYFAKKG